MARVARWLERSPCLHAHAGTPKHLRRHATPAQGQTRTERTPSASARYRTERRDLPTPMPMPTPRSGWNRNAQVPLSRQRPLPGPLEAERPVGLDRGSQRKAGGRGRAPSYAAASFPRRRGHGSRCRNSTRYRPTTQARPAAQRPRCPVAPLPRCPVAQLPRCRGCPTGNAPPMDPPRRPSCRARCLGRSARLAIAVEPPPTPRLHSRGDAATAGAAGTAPGTGRPPRPGRQPSRRGCPTGNARPGRSATRRPAA